MSPTRLLACLGVVVVLAGVAGAVWATNRWGTSAAARPDAADAEPEGVVCTGRVDLERGVRSLAPLRPGRVAEVLVREGQEVEAGAPLLRLEDREAQFQADEAEAALAAAEAQLEQARELPEQHQAQINRQQAAVEAAALRVASAREALEHKEEWFRKERLEAREVTVARNLVQELEGLERAEREKVRALRLDDPALAVRKARSEADVARARLRQARHQQDECTLRAPAAGTVQRVFVGKGDVFPRQPGLPAVRFCPNEPRLVRAEVDQEFADRVRVGQAALVKDDARPRAVWRGQVVRVADWYDRRRPNPEEPASFTDVQTVEFLVALAPDQPPPRIGQRVRVLIGPGPGD
jgi:multidrug resistance efflux pump